MQYFIAQNINLMFQCAVAYVCLLLCDDKSSIQNREF